MSLKAEHWLMCAWEETPSAEYEIVDSVTFSWKKLFKFQKNVNNIVLGCQKKTLL